MSGDWHRPTGDGTGWDEVDPITESMRAQGMAGLNGPVGDPARDAAKKPTAPTPPASTDLAYAIGRLLSHYRIEHSPAGVRISGQAPLEVYGEMEHLRRLAVGGSEEYAAKARVPSERRFGERLREATAGIAMEGEEPTDCTRDGAEEPCRACFGCGYTEGICQGRKEAAAWLEGVAAAIDQDADSMHGEMLGVMGERLDDLRQEVAQLVEELRFAVGPGWRPERIEMHVEVEPFLERLAGIFGARQEGLKRIKMDEDAKWFEVPGRDGAKGLRVAVNSDGSVGLWPVDPAVGSGFALHAEAARDLETILRAMLPGEFALAAGRDANPS